MRRLLLLLLLAGPGCAAPAVVAPEPEPPSTAPAAWTATREDDRAGLRIQLARLWDGSLEVAATWAPGARRAEPDDVGLAVETVDGRLVECEEVASPTPPERGELTLRFAPLEPVALAAVWLRVGSRVERLEVSPPPSG